MPMCKELEGHVPVPTARKIKTNLKSMSFLGFLREVFLERQAKPDSHC